MQSLQSANLCLKHAHSFIHHHMPCLRNEAHEQHEGEFAKFKLTQVCKCSRSLSEQSEYHLCFQPQEETNPLARLPSSLNFIIDQQSEPSPYLHTAIQLPCMVLMLQKRLCDRQPICISSPAPC